MALRVRLVGCKPHNFVIIIRSNLTDNTDIPKMEKAKEAANAWRLTRQHNTRNENRENLVKSWAVQLLLVDYLHFSFYLLRLIKFRRKPFCRIVKRIIETKKRCKLACRFGSWQWMDFSIHNFTDWFVNWI